MKGDSYYAPRYDDDPDYREESDDESDESDVPASMQRDRAQWVMNNHDELVEVYDVFRKAGAKIFGRAFFQTGGIDKFAKFCYKYSMPGA